MSANTIAIVGMSGRFPGATDLVTFWKNLAAGTESIRFYSDDELRANGVSEDDLADPHYVRASARLDDIDKFDAAFFGISPRDASVFDPQHRFFLEVAWEAFEDAGYVGERIDGPVAVFGASGMSEYMMKNLMTNHEVVRDIGEWLLRHTGNDTNFLATRVAYELNLRGPAMNVQTACSSSLVAVHLACQSLLNGECDVALAGGSTIYPDQDRGYFFKEGEILSRDGHCRPFDAGATGTTMGSATACVVLKRLADAERDGDHVRAIVLGSAVNNDGDDKVGYLAPSVSGQARVVTEALALAGVAADEVSYVEAHGTATRIGDPIELAGLTQAFRESTSRTQFCAIGSLKSNIGHAGEASGIAGLVKTVLALEHRAIPPSINYSRPNPQCDLARSPFVVNAALRPWAGPRIAGVTSLGAGGTNAHLLLSEAPEAPPSGPGRAQHLLVLSAKTLASLEKATDRLAEHLRGHGEESLADVAFTLACGRKEFRYRRALVASDPEDAAAALATRDSKRVATRQHEGSERPLAFLFPGGGAQYAAMGRGLHDAEPVYRETVNECLRLVQPMLRADLRSLLLPSPAALAEATTQLEGPALALPALFITEFALATLLKSWGITPQYLLGHSAGEYTAACLAGVMTTAEALSLVATRGRLFESLPKGAMLSVQMAADEVRPLLGTSLSIAAVNAPGMCVVSGPVARVAELEAALVAREVECQRVHIEVAAHSAMLEPILEEFGRFCRTIRFQKPRVPFVSNLTGTWITDDEATSADYWVKHLRNTVQFDAGARTLLAAAEGVVLLEVGPGRALTGLVSQQARTLAAFPTLRHPKETVGDLGFLFAALGRAWSAGVAIDWPAFHAGEPRRRVGLPTYAWDHQRFWVTPGAARGARSADEAALAAPPKKLTDLQQWLHVPSWTRSVPAAAAADERAVWLLVTGGSSLDGPLSEALRLRGGTVITVSPAERFARVGDRAYTVSLARAEDFTALVADLRERSLLPTRVAHLLALTPSVIPGRGLLLRVGGRRREYEHQQARAFGSQAFLAAALAREVEAFHWATVIEGVQRLGDDGPAHPERATALGVPRVIGREFPGVTAAIIDVVTPKFGSVEHATLVDRLATELEGAGGSQGVAYRNGDRFLERYEPFPLPPVSKGNAQWLRPGAVYVISGGLGGLGLTIAEHIARSAPGAKVVLVSRAPLPDAARWDDLLTRLSPADDLRRRLVGVRTVRSLGAEVVVVNADVTDRPSLEAALGGVRARFGKAHAVLHCAGVLDDVLLAARGDRATSPVLDAKVKGALALDAIFGNEPAWLVLFSSVSSILGLPGQADYTAGNAFLDAFAHAHRHEAGRRTVSVNWSAWQEVGMAATLGRQALSLEAGRRAPVPPGSTTAMRTTHPLAEGSVVQHGNLDAVSLTLDPARDWIVGEHKIRGAEPLLPGTGFLELARAVMGLRAEPRPLVLRDIVFLAPFVTPSGQTRTLNVRATRTASAADLTFFSRDPESPHMTARGAYEDVAPPPRRDLDALRARCTLRHQVVDGFLDQHFMDFGGRWANGRSIDFGVDEALLTLKLRPGYEGDLEVYPLHPALLDVATGGAQALVPAFDPLRTFYVPFSYERVTLRSPLPAEFFSHVRLRRASPDTVTFDVTLLDPAGEEIAELLGFTMRRALQPALGAGELGVGRKAESGAHQTALFEALREGILPREGVEVLDRILQVGGSPQVVASSVDVNAWRAELSKAAEPRLEGTGSSGSTFERPDLTSTFLAPRTTLERELALLWRELLGVDHVGVHDDFFELGGQSLLAVRLFTRIRKKYGVDLPLSILFEASTIEACAAIVATAMGVAQTPLDSDREPATAPRDQEPGRSEPAVPPYRALVRIQRGGARTPFFCVHGAGGNVLNFRDLARAMGADQPFYGLQARGIDGTTPPHATLAAMADDYLAEIVGAQPHGPYLLGGYSGGGVVAFEIARRLTNLGEAVSLLAMIDTFHPQSPIREMTMRARVDRARDEGPSYFRDAILGKLSRRQRSKRFDQIDALLREGKTIPEPLRDDHLTRHFERISGSHVLLPWAGHALLFRAEELAYIYRDAGPAYGWDRIIERVDVEPIPGNHANLLLEPNASILTRALGRAISDRQGGNPPAPLRPGLAAGTSRGVSSSTNSTVGSPDGASSTP